MADYTAIQDDSIEPDAPALSRIAFAFRDNPIAIAEGASGAPRVQSAALQDYPFGAEDFQTGTAERNWVLARAAEASNGVVGSYAFLSWTGGAGEVSTGDTRSGSSLKYAALDSEGNASAANSPPGTWRNMGRTVNTVIRTTLWLRVS